MRVFLNKIMQTYKISVMSNFLNKITYCNNKIEHPWNHSLSELRKSKPEGRL